MRDLAGQRHQIRQPFRVYAEDLAARFERSRQHRVAHFADSDTQAGNDHGDDAHDGHEHHVVSERLPAGCVHEDGRHDPRNPALDQHERPKEDQKRAEQYQGHATSLQDRDSHQHGERRDDERAARSPAEQRQQQEGEDQRDQIAVADPIL